MTEQCLLYRPITLISQYKISTQTYDHFIFIFKIKLNLNLSIIWPTLVIVFQLNHHKNTYVIIYWSAIIKQIGYLIDFTEDF